MLQTNTEGKGLNPKLIELTTSFLNKGQRYFGMAAVSLLNQMNDPKYREYNINADLLQAGVDGEKETSLILRKWIADKPDCVLVDSVRLPIKGNLEPEEDDEGQLDLGDTDHLLIIGSRIVVIDSKNWKRKTSYAVANDGQVLRAKQPFVGNRPRTAQLRGLWQSYYQGYNVRIDVPYVCICDPNTFIQRDRNWWSTTFKLVNHSTLTYFLDQLYNSISENDKGIIRVEVVANALRGLVQPYNKFKERFGHQYTKLTGRKV